MNTDRIRSRLVTDAPVTAVLLLRLADDQAHNSQFVRMSVYTRLEELHNAAAVIQSMMASVAAKRETIRLWKASEQWACHWDFRRAINWN